MRERRVDLGLGQAELAQQVGVSRQWIVALERGHRRAELGLVLRVLDLLGAGLDWRLGKPAADESIDAILRKARESKL
ncbi:MAG: helix-turn-helix transcriptional regulator [Caulobacteraceae bacterium]